MVFASLVTIKKHAVLTHRGVGLPQGWANLPQTDAERSGRVGAVRARHPVRFPGGHPRTGHETGQQYGQGRDAESDAGPRYVLRRSAHRAHFARRPAAVPASHGRRHAAIATPRRRHSKFSKIFT